MKRGAWLFLFCVSVPNGLSYGTQMGGEREVYGVARMASFPLSWAGSNDQWEAKRRWEGFVFGHIVCRGPVPPGILSFKSCHIWQPSQLNHLSYFLVCTQVYGGQQGHIQLQVYSLSRPEQAEVFRRCLRLPRF